MRILPVVINLDRRWDRYQRFQSMFPLPHVRYAAQDGIGVQSSGWDRVLINLLRLCKQNPRDMLHGLYGCWKSHYQVWEKLSQDWTHDAYLIMEDDITIGDDFPALFERVQDNITNQFDIYYLGGAVDENYTPPNLEQQWETIELGGLTVHRMHDHSWQGKPFGRGLYAYVLTRQGAERLVNLVARRAASVHWGFPAVDEWINRNRDGVAVCDVFPHRVWVENTGQINAHDSDVYRGPHTSNWQMAAHNQEEQP